MSTHVKSKYPIAMLLGVALLVGPEAWGQSSMRNVRLGDVMEPFTLVDLDGHTVTYKPRRDRVTILTVLAAYQKRSERALDDLTELVSDLRRNELPVDLLIIISGGEGIDYFRRVRDERALDAPMLIDADDAQWGRLGVTVTPATFVIDKTGVFTWIRSGHGYDFAHEMRTRSGLALGILGESEVDADEPVTPLINDSDEARAQRHLRMGQILARKGDVESGIAELRKAVALAPEFASIRLELIRLLCRAGRAEEALVMLELITPETRGERAQVSMLKGWSHRQLGDLEEAITLLTDAIDLDPGSSRALFELGKIYEQGGAHEQAMESYHRALAIQFDEEASSP